MARYLIQVDAESDGALTWEQQAHLQDGLLTMLQDTDLYPLVIHGVEIQRQQDPVIHQLETPTPE